VRASMTGGLVGDLLDGYELLDNCWDELFESPGVPREHYVALHALLGQLTAEEFEARCRARDMAFRDQGITFSLSGEERPFPLDLVRGSSRSTNGRSSRRASPSGCAPSRRSSPSLRAPPTSCVTG